MEDSVEQWYLLNEIYSIWVKQLQTSLGMQATDLKI